MNALISMGLLFDANGNVIMPNSDPPINGVPPPSAPGFTILRVYVLNGKLVVDYEIPDPPPM